MHVIKSYYLAIFYYIQKSHVIDDWQKLLEECLSHEVSVVKLKAAEAHTNFFVEYYIDIDYNARSAVINRYLESLQSNNQSIRIGFAQAIGKK